MKLATALSHEVLRNLASFLPFKIEENKALCDRYEKLHCDVVACKQFVEIGDTGYEFKSGFNVSQFDDELFIQLQEIGFEHNACPLSVAIALVLLPKMIEAGVQKLTESPNRIREAAMSRAVKINEILKERQKNGMLSYHE